jgi:7,8-dihydropterin-6-yl-methyl-4-(beta-D-ribofuranosyl)aminobenzene 5'-phosphate synthase
MRITCIVDDRAPDGTGLKAEHGASFVIENDGRQVLFDTGQSGPVLLQNLAAMGIVPERLDALVVSHAHNDHTGGLTDLLQAVTGIPLYAHPDLFRERFRKTDTGPRKVGPALDRATLAGRVELRLDAEPVEVVPGMWTSGEIAPRPEPEGRSPYHVVRRGKKWVADPYRDDLSVAVEGPEGLVLVCGCCHAGLLNTLARMREVFDRTPVDVIGGTHLVNADAPTLAHVVEELGRLGPPRLWLSHCTGDRAFLSLKAAFGDRVSLCQAGTVLEF